MRREKSLTILPERGGRDKIMADIKVFCAASVIKLFAAVIYESL